MTELDGEYTVYFGPYETMGTPSYRPWTLKHCSIDVEVAGMDTAIGVPNYPARACNIFDMSGPTRTFKIKGTRIDSEEFFSNYDFIHTQFNVKTINEGLKSERFETYVGMEWLLSSLQVQLTGFLLRIVSSSPYHPQPSTTPNGYQGQGRFVEGEFNIGYGGISNTIGEMYNSIDYQITLLERDTYGKTGSKMNVYAPWPRKRKFNEWKPQEPLQNPDQPWEGDV